ncbi:DUF1672 family protein [Pseudalkalibacillus hwajinpoensis]|uniref:DUF1672 family protein n=1 Tax=Guptibacillus hwajinpoensis TaxID=208199 RepID=A0A4U1MJM3_9BACL|nr:DUF1672 family protein [Pseudalkalibacillus hwajinpoensis]TKD70794.1 DUF1672 family protein [Pseudalkalibacillus hwajinpoensis]
MIKKRYLYSSIFCSTLLLSGCLFNDKSEEDIIEDKYFVSVQDYTGEGYTLQSGNDTDKIAEKHKEEVEEAVKAYFKENYQTEVKVHNIVGAVDGATVFVESVGQPHFYSYAIIPVDKDKEEIDPEGVWSQEGQVETAIVSGLYAWVYEDRFMELDTFLEGIVQEYPVIGIREEANENVRGNYFLTPYYKVTVYGGRLEELLPVYLMNPNKTKEEWKSILGPEPIDPSKISITIQMYMEEQDVDPNEKIFDTIVEQITEKDGLPSGKYSFLLHDNTIDKTSAQNNKENSLKNGAPDYIVKE